ncbi:hypothetical protein HOY82DRAFT_541832 [Tuber indicum]|nr:hypothetical protein HOY82DRAFT_541832 [Tuber indicum]
MTNRDHRQAKFRPGYGEDCILENKERAGISYSIPSFAGPNRVSPLTIHAFADYAPRITRHRLTLTKYDPKTRISKYSRHAEFSNHRQGSPRGGLVPAQDFGHMWARSLSQTLAKYPCPRENSSSCASGPGKMRGSMSTRTPGAGAKHIFRHGPREPVLQVSSSSRHPVRPERPAGNSHLATILKRTQQLPIGKVTMHVKNLCYPAYPDPRSTAVVFTVVPFLSPVASLVLGTFGTYVGGVPPPKMSFDAGPANKLFSPR